jgi:phospholipase/carboxylesterase
MTFLPALDHWPTPESDRAAILLHRRGHAPGRMRDLAGAIGLLSWRCVFPSIEGESWYPGHLMDPIENNEPALRDVVDEIAREAARLEDEGFKPENVLIGGFSQGACVTAHYLSRHPVRHLAALILRGALPGEPGTSWPPAPHLAGMPALLTGGRLDPFIPDERVSETAAWLHASGAAVRISVSDDPGHGMDDEDVAEVRKFIESL